MRLFAAVVPPDDVRAELAAALPGDADVRFLPAERWHLTMAFYGDVTEAVAHDLAARLGRAAGRTPGFALSLGAGGTFPGNPRRARVLWVGVGGDVPVLTRLAERAVAAGRRAGVDMEERRYRAHLTLARLGRTGRDVSAVVDALAGFAGRSWPVTELVLMRSHLGPRPSYEPVGRWPLRGRPAEATGG